MRDQTTQAVAARWIPRPRAYRAHEYGGTVDDTSTAFAVSPRRIARRRARLSTR